MIEAMVASLILKRASASRSSGEWNDDDFDVLANGAYKNPSNTAARKQNASALIMKCMISPNSAQPELSPSIRA